MFQKLVNHNEDIRRLVEKGYAISIDSNCLVIRDIPYLDANLDVQIGAIVVKLVFVDNERVTQDNHQIYFAGSIPHGLDGAPVKNMGVQAHKLPLSDACSDIAVQWAFSNKPKSTGRYEDHHHKVETYVGFISGPAEHLHGTSPRTFREIEQCAENSVFKFHDTLTSRAEINDMSSRFKDDNIAIIGLGGTGAYILDYLVKTPVQTIRGFDHDKYYVHNAYRSPGRLEESELDRSKAEVYQARYDNFRTGLMLKTTYIDDSCRTELDGVTFAFVCVDSGLARAHILDLLSELNIPCIDVGMGLSRKSDTLNGMMRTTYFPPELHQGVRAKKWVNELIDPENIYKSNIQISELNALNASIAVIRYKQIRNFYEEELGCLNTLFNLSSLSSLRETCLE